MDYKKTGFTLIEVLISLFLSAMVAFFIYTMMVSAYNAYRRISSVSRNANSIRYFIANISNSIKNAKTIPTIGVHPVTGTTSLTFSVYNKQYKAVVKERYYFDGGSELIESASSSVSVSTDTHHAETMGVLKKDIINSDNQILETLIISNIIRSIYFSWTGPSSVARHRKMNLGVVYDDVIDGQVNLGTGKLEARADNMTEMLDEGTLTRRLFCYCFRNFHALN